MSDSPRRPSLPKRRRQAHDGALRALAARARAVDGQPPFSDQSLIDLGTGVSELIWIGDVAAAIVTAPIGSAPTGSAQVGTATEAEFVVDPDARGIGHGTAMLERLISRSPGDLLVWAHGDHPAARVLAHKHGLTPVRELLRLRASVPEVPASHGRATPAPGGMGTSGADHSAGISAFRPSVDDAGWLALNARAFADHPEQGSLAQADLNGLMAEPWFTAEDFLVLRNGENLIGYCWLKVEGGDGELYAVGVDPEPRGEGLGRRLVGAGLIRLAERGIRTAHLYVEGDNAAALRLYRLFGFREDSIDIQYRWHNEGVKVVAQDDSVVDQRVARAVEQDEPLP